MAPPRNSRAVMCRLAKWRLTSASGICAARASRKSASTSLPDVAQQMPCGYADETVEVTTWPSRSTVMAAGGQLLDRRAGTEKSF